MSLTKKHLEVLAEALADTAAYFGADEEETVDRAERVTNHLVREGALTPHFDADRFEHAVRAAYRGA